MSKCSNCGNVARWRCGKCKNATYCDERCQREHWGKHQKCCMSGDAVGSSIMVDSVSNMIIQGYRIKNEYDNIGRREREDRDERERKEDEFEGVSKLRFNPERNRYGNVIPNPEYRVILGGRPPDDDYINASWVIPNRVIATQHPLEKDSRRVDTRGDFWHMVYENRVPAIVMLLKLDPTNPDRMRNTIAYWPEKIGEMKTFGSINVRLLNHTMEGNVIHRLFEIALKTSPEDVRKVNHFQYELWPDNGVPSNPRDVIQIINTMDTHVGPNAAPIVVHCSAGIGRTGTFIAIREVVHQLQEAKEKHDSNPIIDVEMIVSNMRRARFGMVHTLEQYTFCYRAICAIAMDLGFIKPGDIPNPPSDLVGCRADDGMCPD